MDIVIPVTRNSKNNYLELKYALRSAEKHLKYFDNVWIVGTKIYSLKDLKYIPLLDDKLSKFKERNIFRKIMAACNHPEVSDNFIFMNDDHFITNDFSVLPYFHKGELADTMAKNLGDYRKSVNHSRKYLLEKGRPTLDYDTHFPIVYNKKKFIDTFVCKDINFDRPFGYVIKSLYCNMNGIEGEFGGDCKIQRKMNYEELKAKIHGKSFFSTADGSINEDMVRLLDDLYPMPSRFER